jgi:hypothetical protein
VARVLVKFLLETFCSFVFGSLIKKTLHNVFVFLLFQISIHDCLTKNNNNNMQPVIKTSSQPRSPSELTTAPFPAYKCGWLYKRGI